jgi:hypothetical protein
MTTVPGQLAPVDPPPEHTPGGNITAAIAATIAVNKHGGGHPRAQAGRSHGCRSRNRESPSVSSILFKGQSMFKIATIFVLSLLCASQASERHCHTSKITGAVRQRTRCPAERAQHPRYNHSGDADQRNGTSVCVSCSRHFFDPQKKKKKKKRKK